MTHPTKPLDIEAEAHALLLKHTDTAIKQFGRMYNTVQTSEALAAISELLTRLREVENTNYAYVVDQYKDALSQLSTSQALLEECREVVDRFKFWHDKYVRLDDSDNDKVCVGVKDLRRATSLIEKLDGQFNAEPQRLGLE